MKNTSKTSVTLTAAAVLGMSLVASHADAQGWRGNSNYNNNRGYSQPVSGFDQGWGRYSRSSSQRDTLRIDVITVDRLAQQMTSEFARELRYNRGCRESIALLNHMQNYTRTTQDLVRASNGTCKVTFKKAACKVRETLTCVQNQSKRVRNLSCSVKGMIDQSCPIATRIHNSADRFNPVSVTTVTVPHGNHTHEVPVTTNPRGNRGNNGYSNQIESPLFSILSSLFSR
jgi:hypothetical protein